MQAHLSVARNILTNRLNRLVDSGILERIPYRERGQRTRHEYRLTAKGADLLPALMALSQWGDRHHPHRKGRPLMLRHRETGQEVRAELVQADGTRLKNLRELEPVFWPDTRPE
jgi:DNA-binding HxlR family transcriptional regulator